MYRVPVNMWPMTIVACSNKLSVKKSIEEYYKKQVDDPLCHLHLCASKQLKPNSPRNRIA